MFINIKGHFINLDHVHHIEVYHNEEQEAAVIAVHYERTYFEMEFPEFAYHEDELEAQFYTALYRKNLCTDFKPLSQHSFCDKEN